VSPLDAFDTAVPDGKARHARGPLMRHRGVAPVCDRVPVTDTEQTRELRKTLVEQLSRDFNPSAAVLAAIARVPRHAFVPDIDPVTAYIDDAVITRRDAEGHSTSSISQPSMVAQMLDALDLEPGQRVLEIGAGTGYCAALIAELVGATGAVTTIDVEPDITDEAARNLDANGFSRVTVTCADGALGDADGAPWDRILVSVGAWEPSPEWIVQLASDGKLVMPLAIQGIQRIVTFERAAHGLRSMGVLAGGFLAQRGRDARPRITLRLDDDVAIDTEHDLGIGAAAVREALDSEPVRMWTGVELPYPGHYDRLIVYLALHHPCLFTMSAPRTVLPEALRAWNLVYGVAQGLALGHLALRTVEPAGLERAHEVGVAAYGPGAVALAERLANDVQSWGRIMEADPVFDVFPKPHAADMDRQGVVILDKRHSIIQVTWPDTSAPGPGQVASTPVVHQMRLRKEFMDLVADGKKVTEVRCNDSKRQRVRAGDTIVFTSGDEQISVDVLEVRRYADFAALYRFEDPADINPGATIDEQLQRIGEFYSEEQQRQGAVAIAIRRL
jgi:protein-L-isoaspartate(D-aspartate) O-methyltransferase